MRKQTTGFLRQNQVVSLSIPQIPQDATKGRPCRVCPLCVLLDVLDIIPIPFLFPAAVLWFVHYTSKYRSQSHSRLLHEFLQFPSKDPLHWHTSLKKWWVHRQSILLLHFFQTAHTWVMIFLQTFSRKPQPYDTSL